MIQLSLQKYYENILEIAAYRWFVYIKALRSLANLAAFYLSIYLLLKVRFNSFYTNETSELHSFFIDNE